MWDMDANGYARGDGVAACILKTLSAAIEDGDDIECIIRETGFNQDGATTDITMPSVAAQQALIRSTYSKAGPGSFKGFGPSPVLRDSWNWHASRRPDRGRSYLESFIR